MPPKGHRQSAETIAKRIATRARNAKLRAAKAEGQVLAPRAEMLNGKDAAVYLHHALRKWPVEKKRSPGIAKLYVQLALATLEGDA
jgi:hypothetical protein